MNRVFTLVCLFVFANFSESFAQDNTWALKKEKNGIKVFVRSNEESRFDEFRATTVIEGVSLNDALDVILNVNNYEAWYPDCSNPQILEQIDEYHYIHYTETISPWPVDDRCGVYEQSAVISNYDTKAVVEFTAIPDYPIDVKDMIRITDAWGRWIFEEKNHLLTITYEFRGNPGGDIPAWLANSFVVKHPFETLENLKMVLGKN